MSKDADNEVWKDVKGYEGLYQISNFGRVKSLDRSVMLRGNFYKLKSKILKQTDNGCGYLIVSFSKNNKQTKKYIHRLVAENFLKNKKQEVNHKNGIKKDNNLKNLEWVTRSENIKHAWKNNLFDREKRVAIATKNSRERSRKVFCKDIKTKDVETFKGIWEAEKKGYSRACIYNVISGNLYTHKGKVWSKEKEKLDLLIEKVKKAKEKTTKKRRERAIKRNRNKGHF